MKYKFAFVVGTSIYFILCGIIIWLIAFWGYKYGVGGASKEEIVGTIKFVFVPISLVPITTGIGIFLKKKWARRLVNILSVAILFLGLFMSLPTFIGAIYGNLKQPLFPLMLLIFGILPSIFFLIYFNKQDIKEQFK